MAKKTPAIVLKHCTIHIHVPALPAMPETDREPSEVVGVSRFSLAHALGNLAETESSLGRMIDQAIRVSQETAERSLDRRTAEQRYADEIGQGPLDIEAKRAAVQRAIETIERNSRALQEDSELHEIDLPDEALPTAIKAGLTSAAIEEVTAAIVRQRRSLGQAAEAETRSILSNQIVDICPYPENTADETTAEPSTATTYDEYVASGPEQQTPTPEPAADGRRCPYPGCTELITRQAVACRKHWRQVKKAKTQAAHLVEVAHRKNGALQPQQA